jgi:hypothetical protein
VRSGGRHPRSAGLRRPPSCRPPGRAARARRERGAGCSLHSCSHLGGATLFPAPRWRSTGGGPYERSSLKSSNLWTRSATPGLSLPGSNSLWVTDAMSVSEVTCICMCRQLHAYTLAMSVSEVTCICMCRQLHAYTSTLTCAVYHTNAIIAYARVGRHLPHVQLESRAIPVRIVDSVPSDLRG